MRQLFIDSRDRVSGTTTDFTIQLPETLSLGSGHRGRIDFLRIPVTIPTIRTGINDTFVVLIGSTSYTISSPQANYDGTGLASAIQSRLAATAPGAWTVVYDSSNIAMRITCSNPYTITGGTYAAQLMNHPYTQTSNSYSFTYVSVQGIDVMYLSSPNFANLNTVGPGGSHDTLMCAVVTCPFGGVLDASMESMVMFDIPAMTTQQLSFQLRDRSYRLLTIVPNISFVLTID